MATIIDLGQKVKAKYPEYSDMSDIEVGRRIKAKYSEYSDFEDVEEAPKEMGMKPTYKASIGGAETIIPNIAKTIGNIPSSAGNIIDLTLQSTAGNIGRSIEELQNIYKEQGFIEGTKNIVSGFADVGSKIFKAPGEFLVGRNEKMKTENLLTPIQKNALKQRDEILTKLQEAKRTGRDTTALVKALKYNQETLGSLAEQIDTPENRGVASMNTLTDIVKYPIERPLDIPLALETGGPKSNISKISNFVTKGSDTSLSNIGSKISSKIVPKSEDILNRTNKLTPTQVNDFKKLSGGESHGAYFERTGNYGNPVKTVENEAIKLNNSLKEVDGALETLEGRFKAKPLDDILDDLIERERRIGVSDSETRKITNLFRKNKGEGLDMAEINWLKRKYERDVKLSYQQERNAIGTARATRLDSALRSWQLIQAKKLGLKNLDKLNKQTQLSKFLVNKLGGQIAGKSGNEAISLTDWIILSGGDPTAISAFFVKKTLLNKTNLSKFAKLFSKKKPEGAIRAEFGGKSGLPAKIPGRDYSTTIQVKAPKSATTYEPPAQKINRSSLLFDNQNLLTAPKSSAQGIPISLPKSARESNLGINEIKKLKRQLEALKSNKKKKKG